MGNQDSKSRSALNSSKYQKVGKKSQRESDKFENKNFETLGDEQNNEGTSVDTQNNNLYRNSGPELAEKMSGLPGEIASTDNVSSNDSVRSEEIERKMKGSHSKEDKLWLLTNMSETDYIEIESKSESPVETSNLSYNNETDLSELELSNSSQITDTTLNYSEHKTSAKVPFMNIDSEVDNTNKIQSNDVKITEVCEIKSEGIALNIGSENPIFQGQSAELTGTNSEERSKGNADGILSFQKLMAKEAEFLLEDVSNNGINMVTPSSAIQPGEAQSETEKHSAETIEDTSSVDKEALGRSKDKQNNVRHKEKKSQLQDGIGNKSQENEFDKQNSRICVVTKKHIGSRMPNSKISNLSPEQGIDCQKPLDNQTQPEAAFGHGLKLTSNGMFKKKVTWATNDNRINLQDNDIKDENSSRKTFGIYSNVMFLPDKSKGASPKRHGPKKLGMIMPAIADDESEDSDKTSESEQQDSLIEADVHLIPNMKETIPTDPKLDLPQINYRQDGPYQQYSTSENQLEFIEDHFGLFNGCSATGVSEGFSATIKSSVCSDGHNCPIRNSADLKPVCGMQNDAPGKTVDNYDIERSIHAETIGFTSAGNVTSTAQSVFDVKTSPDPSLDDNFVSVDLVHCMKQNVSSIFEDEDLIYEHEDVAQKNGCQKCEDGQRNKCNDVTFPTFRRNCTFDIDWSILKSKQGLFARNLKSCKTNIAEDNRQCFEFSLPFFAGKITFSDENAYLNYAKSQKHNTNNIASFIVGSYEECSVNDLDVSSDDNEPLSEGGGTNKSTEQTDGLRTTNTASFTDMEYNAAVDTDSGDLNKIDNVLVDKDEETEVETLLLAEEIKNEGRAKNELCVGAKTCIDISGVAPIRNQDQHQSYHVTKQSCKILTEKQETVAEHLKTMIENDSETETNENPKIKEDCVETKLDASNSFTNDTQRIVDVIEDETGTDNRELQDHATNDYESEFKRRKTNKQDDNRLVIIDDEEDYALGQKVTSSNEDPSQVKSKNVKGREAKDLKEKERDKLKNRKQEKDEHMSDPFGFPGFDLSHLDFSMPPHLFQEYISKLAESFHERGDPHVSGSRRTSQKNQSSNRNAISTNKNKNKHVGAKKNPGQERERKTEEATDSDQDSSLSPTLSTDSSDEEEVGEQIAELDDANWDAVVKQETIKCRQAIESPQNLRCTVLCVDISESMMGEPWSQIKDVLEKFVKGLDSIKAKYGTTELVSMVTFGHETKVALTPTTDYSQILSSFDKLECKGNTPLEPVLFLALFPVLVTSNSRYDCKVYERNVRHRAILLTDCQPTPHKILSDTDDVTERQSLDAAESVLRKMKNLNSQNLKNIMNIHCIPIGINPNTELMEVIAKKSGGDIVPCTDINSLCTNTHNYLNSLQITRHIIDSGSPEMDRQLLSSIITNLYQGISEADLIQMISEIKIELKKDRKQKGDKKEKKNFSGVGLEESDGSDEDSDDDSQGKSCENDSNKEVEGMPRIGTRVKRGPDFDKDEIVVISELGTITGHSVRDKKKCLFVHWDCGVKTYCRYGEKDCFDVILDEVTHIPCRLEDQIKVGYKVRRGPDWQYGDQDGGSDKLGTVYNIFDNGVEVQVRWDTNDSFGLYRYNYDGAYDVLISTPDDPFDIQRHTHEMNRKNFAKIRGIDINSAVHYRHEKLHIDLDDSLFGLDLQGQDKGHVNKNKNTCMHRKKSNTDLMPQTGAIPKEV